MPNLDIHLHHDPLPPDHHHHTEEHFQSSEFVQDVVIGMADGLTVPFALTAGLSGAVSATGLIITAGLAEIAAGSIAMGLGGYLAGKTAVEHYQNELKREYWEVDNLPHVERKEVEDFFESLGLSEENRRRATDEICKDKDRWVDFMMKFELGLEKPDPRRATKSGMTIGGAYVAGGLVPLIPYFFVENVQTGLVYSAIVTTIFLFVFGYFKSRATGQHPFWGAVRVTIIGVVAAGAAWLIATLIESSL